MYFELHHTKKIKDDFFYCERSLRLIKYIKQRRGQEAKNKEGKYDKLHSSHNRSS